MGEEPVLTRKQHQLLLFIDERLSETGLSPSFDDMKEALDLKSKSGVHRLISALEERGFVKRLADRVYRYEAAEEVAEPTLREIAREEFWIVAKSFFAPLYGTFIVLRQLLKLTGQVDGMGLHADAHAKRESGPDLMPAE